MNCAEIKKTDIANGTGVRVSLFVSGCTHHCKGCFNESTWDFTAGEPFTPEVEERILAILAPSHISGLSLLGGEPFEPQNQIVLAPFVRRVRERFPEKDVWCYTGCVLERDLLPPAAGAAPPAPATGLILDPDTKTVTIDGAPVPFTRTEFDLLRLLLEQPGRVYSRAELLARAWPEDVIVTERTVDVNITRIRKKLGPYAARLRTRSGFGYYFSE